MAKIRTHYDNLKVARNAPDSVIKAAYKALCQTYHPDKFEGSKEEAERIMKIVNASYVVLIDPVKRALHDTWIDEQEAKSTQQSEKAQFGATGEATEQQYYQRQDKYDIPKNEETPPPKNPTVAPTDKKFNEPTKIVIFVALLLAIYGKYVGDRYYLSIGFLLAIWAIFYGLFREEKPYTLTNGEPPTSRNFNSQNESPEFTSEMEGFAVLATMWPRFFARIFDVWLETMLINFVLLFTIGDFSTNFIGSNYGMWIYNEQYIRFIIEFLSLPIALALDAVIYNVFGNSLGKAWLGLKVVTLDGGPLSFSQYLKRNFSLWISGLGGGVIGVNIGAMISEANRLRKGLQASYDESSETRVWSYSSGWVQKSIFGCAFAGLLGVILMVDMLDRIFDSKQKKARLTEAVVSVVKPKYDVEADLAEYVPQNNFENDLKKYSYRSRVDASNSQKRNATAIDNNQIVNTTQDGMRSGSDSSKINAPNAKQENKEYISAANELIAIHPELGKDGPLADKVMALTNSYINVGMKAPEALRKAVKDLYPVTNAPTVTETKNTYRVELDDGKLFEIKGNIENLKKEMKESRLSPLSKYESIGNITETKHECVIKPVMTNAEIRNCQN